MHYEEALARKRAHYDAYDVAAFEQRLAAFERLNLRDPGLDLARAVDHVVRDPVSGVAVFSMSWDEMPVGTLLWRARRMSAEVLKEGRVTVSDLWEPPAAHATPGRYNHAGEPVLYACLEPPLEALKEARIAESGSGFILIGYEVLEPIPLRRVGVANADEGLKPRHQALEERMSQFLAEVLSYTAAEYGAEAYAHTRRLLRKFFPLEPGWECGWIYASAMEGPQLINVAIEAGQAHSRLSVWRVIAGSVGYTAEGDTGVYLAGWSDGLARFGEDIGFADFPHDELSGVQEYFDYLQCVERADGMK